MTCKREVSKVSLATVQTMQGIQGFSTIVLIRDSISHEELLRLLLAHSFRQALCARHRSNYPLVILFAPMTEEAYVI